MAIQDDEDMIGTGVDPVEPDEIDALRARVAELERERDQLALSLSATKAERDHAVRSAELLEDELHNSESARRDFEHAWLEGRAIMAVCGYFSRMRGPDLQVAYKQFGGGYTRRFLKSEDAVRVHRDEGYEMTPLYAGSAPVPAAQAVDVDAICNAYESGVGHRGRPTANVNPYRECTPEHEAYAIGAKGEAAQAEAKAADSLDLPPFLRQYPHDAPKGKHLCECGKSYVSNDKNFVTVPVHPTTDMLLAGFRAVFAGPDNGFVGRVWSAMLAAKAKGGS